MSSSTWGERKQGALPLLQPAATKREKGRRGSLSLSPPTALSLLPTFLAKLIAFMAIRANSVVECGGGEKKWAAGLSNGAAFLPLSS